MKHKDTGASVTPTELGGPEGLEPQSRLHASHAIPSADAVQDVRDLIILAYEHCDDSALHRRGASALRTVNALEVAARP